jgi:biopolymer transport protein ExbB
MTSPLPDRLNHERQLTPKPHNPMHKLYPFWSRNMQDMPCLGKKSFLLAGIVLALSLFCPSSLSAQDDLDAALGGDAAPPPAAPADAAPAGNAPAANNSAGETTAPTNLLTWTFQALGISYTVIFFALSITLLTLIVMNLLAARQDNICPPDLVEGVEQQLAQGNPQAAAELVRTDDSFLGQVVAAGLSKLERGHTHAIEAMQEVGEEETMKMEHNLSYMALIGNISPMIGLFGTVQGMIQAFQTIATSGTTPKPSDLAMNISTALFTTLAGLAIAIPAIAIYNILRNRVQRLTLQVGVTSEELIERFQG